MHDSILSAWIELNGGKSTFSQMHSLCVLSSKEIQKALLLSAIFFPSSLSETRLDTFAYMRLHECNVCASVRNRVHFHLKWHLVHQRQWSPNLMPGAAANYRKLREAFFVRLHTIYSTIHMDGPRSTTPKISNVWRRNGKIFSFKIYFPRAKKKSHCSLIGRRQLLDMQ